MRGDNKNGNLCEIILINDPAQANVSGENFSAEKLVLSSKCNHNSKSLNFTWSRCFVCDQKPSEVSEATDLKHFMLAVILKTSLEGKDK